MNRFGRDDMHMAAIFPGIPWRARVAACLMGAASATALASCPAGNPLVAPSSRYVVSEPDPIGHPGQRVVTDNDTGLVWKHCHENQSGAACGKGTYLPSDWSGALGAARNSSHAGFHDWRLPNIAELQSLVETGCVAPSINATIFPNTVVNTYWSSTTLSTNPSYAWNVDFYNGLQDPPALKSDIGAVRLVRGGQLHSFAAEGWDLLFRDGFEGGAALLKKTPR